MEKNQDIKEAMQYYQTNPFRPTGFDVSTAQGLRKGAMAEFYLVKKEKGIIGEVPK